MFSMISNECNKEDEFFVDEAINESNNCLKTPSKKKNDSQPLKKNRWERYQYHGEDFDQLTVQLTL